jgi:molybdopterin synthase catalytic subunit
MEEAGAVQDPQGRCWVAVTEAPLDPRELERFVSAAELGGVVTFSGLVRNHNRGRGVEFLEYDGYRPMAERELARIAREAATRWGGRIAIHHRLGRLEIGEASVVVAAACAHRAEAFEACRFAIDTLKRTVPIWKREVWEGGEAWIEGPADAPSPAPPALAPAPAPPSPAEPRRERP